MRSRRAVHFVLTLLFAVAASAAAQLAPGVDLIPGSFVPNTQPDGNSIVFRAPKGLIVVDTGRHPEHTQAIVDFAKSADLPVAAVINSHWHLDHIGGNAMLRKAYPGVRVFASSALDDARKGFLANYRAQLEEMIARTKDPDARKPWLAEVAIIDSGAALAPDEIVKAGGMQTIAGRPLMLGLESHAVTAGDVWVFDAATGVLASGDLVTLPAPFLDTACPAQWQRALDRVGKVDFKLLVPGHGAPMHRAEFETYRTAFSRLLSCAAAKDQPASACIDGWMTDAAPLLKNEKPAFVRSLMSYYVDQLRGDPARIAKLCGE